MKIHSRTNEHFSIEKLFDGNETLIGYLCIYQWLTNRIQFEYHIDDHRWKILSKDCSGNEEKLNQILEDVNQAVKLNVRQQIDFILYRYDQYFDGFSMNIVILLFH